jgi:hypothetical protein
MTKAASLLVERLKHEKAHAKPPAADQQPPAPAYKPIWEVADELRESVPVKDWAKVPVDGAAQHDHYIYGTRKRPTP